MFDPLGPFRGMFFVVLFVVMACLFTLVYFSKFILIAVAIAITIRVVMWLTSPTKGTLNNGPR